MDTAFLAVLDELEVKREEIRCSRSGAFFRGHSQPQHRLIPSLMRIDATFELEHNLFHECHSRSRHLLARGANSWEVLSILQHNGIPTRLLDWTESFAIALFFSLQGPAPSPRVWIVNPFLLNRANGFLKRSRIPLVGLDPLPDYADSFVRVEERAPWPFAKPIFVAMPWASERIAAQQGFFTIHPGSEPLDAVSPRWIRHVDIPTEAIAGAFRFLNIAGVNEYDLFPDLQGLGRFLRTRYRLP